jgi:ribose transport system ATP-binding protein
MIPVRFAGKQITVRNTSLEQTPVLELKNISKSFSGNRVLDEINLKLGHGEVLGIIGENGAGKSTLIKIICGVYNLDQGEIFFDGEKVEFQNPEQSRNRGISTIYQELSLFPSLTVAQNIFIARELDQTGIHGIISPIDNRKMEAEARRILHDVLGTDINIHSLVENLSMAEKQLVEIARALYSQSRIIIMDEPTTALEAREKEQLFQIIRDVKKIGTSVIFVSHYLQEVMKICDHIFVLRDGQCVLDKPADETSVENMIKAMIGRSLEKQYPKEIVPIGEKVLSVKNLTRKKVFQDVSFELHEGEIIGIVGLVGCGKNELIRAMFGIDRFDSGSIETRRKRYPSITINDAMRDRIAFIPADRKTEGIFGIKSVKWNMLISALDLIIKNSWISYRSENRLANGYIDKLKIKTGSSSQTIASLSGGNQQKVLLARWFLTDPQILLLEDPTRGIDVSVKTEVYKLLIEFAKKGNAVVLVSSDEEEVVGICDRVIVLHKGRVSANVKTSETSVEQIKIYSEISGEQQ